jgi:hypothetical protein
MLQQAYIEEKISFDILIICMLGLSFHIVVAISACVFHVAINGGIYLGFIKILELVSVR